MRSVVAVTLLVSSLAVAAPGSVRAVIEVPAAPPKTDESPYLYLNRCSGGCMVTGGPDNDATTLASNIPTPGEYLIGEFATETGATGSAADAEWAELVQCVEEVYSPFAVMVTDTLPTGVTYTEALVAGIPGDIGRPEDNLGISVLSSNCAPIDDGLAFIFANSHPGTGMDRIYQICWTAAQESAHLYGLDHEWMFTDGESACRDPMTYRTDCGGEKFFRNMRAECGRFMEEPCKCGGTQNSAAILTSVFGAGTPITAPPHVAITYPTASASITSGITVHATAGAQRGVAEVELYVNGSRWANSFMVAAFGAEGQPDADYAITLPTRLPDGILDIVIRADDDLGVSTDSAVVEVEKGSPCTTANDCLPDQTCDAGKCDYPPPTLALGSACSYDQQCTTWECGDFSDGSACTTDCEVDEPTSCPATYTCFDAGDGHGRCAIGGGGGCCDASGGSPTSLATAAILALVLRRRRRR